jgi:hypothetical protein
MDSDFATHYERLRDDALALPARSPAPGMALFQRRGMIAWMRAWSCCTQPPVRKTAPESPLGSSCSIEMRTQMALIVAGIILGQQREVRRQ